MAYDIIALNLYVILLLRSVPSSLTTTNPAAGRGSCIKNTITCTVLLATHIYLALKTNPKTRIKLKPNRHNYHVFGDNIIGAYAYPFANPPGCPWLFPAYRVGLTYGNLKKKHVLTLRIFKYFDYLCQHYTTMSTSYQNRLYRVCLPKIINM